MAVERLQNTDILLGWIQVTIKTTACDSHHLDTHQTTLNKILMFHLREKVISPYSCVLTCSDPSQTQVDPNHSITGPPHALTAGVRCSSFSFNSFYCI